MKLQTVASTWYEAVMVKGYGCRLDGCYDNKREAQKAIKEYKARVVERGYKADEYFILMCNCIRMFDENGDTVSETITKTRV